MKRILITGANGHLGRLLIARLFAMEPPRPAVRALVRSERAAEGLQRLPEAARPEIVVAGYHDTEGIAAAAKDCDAVVHLVGILKQTAGNRYSDAHESVTYAVARAAADAGARRVVYLSILGADPGSRNRCLASKGRAERILLDHEAPATVIRLPMVLGLDDHATRALRAKARASLVPLVRGGASYEQPIDARDVVEAVWRALVDPDREDLVLDLAGPESIRHRELVARAAALLGTRPRILRVPRSLARVFAMIGERLLANPPLTRPMLGVLDHDDRIDPAPACRRLGLTLTPLDQTLRRCVGVPGPAA